MKMELGGGNLNGCFFGILALNIVMTLQHFFFGVDRLSYDFIESSILDEHE